MSSEWTRAVIVIILLACIVVPIVRAEMRRPRRRPVRSTRSARPAPRLVEPKREPTVKPPLRLVVDKDDMDRELAALLAQDVRKPTDKD